MEYHKIFIITGPSAVGKSSLVKRVWSSDGDMRLGKSFRTRPDRGGDNDGLTVYMDDERFKEHLANDDFIAYTNIYGYLYGTLRETWDTALNCGHGDIIQAMDFEGIRQVKQSKYASRLVSIYLLPAAIVELRQRIDARKGTDMSKKLRKEAIQHELLDWDKYDYCLINYSLDDTQDKIRQIVNYERLRVKRRQVHSIHVDTLKASFIYRPEDI